MVLEMVPGLDCELAVPCIIWLLLESIQTSWFYIGGHISAVPFKPCAGHYFIPLKMSNYFLLTLKTKSTACIWLSNYKSCDST